MSLVARALPIQKFERTRKIFGSSELHMPSCVVWNPALQDEIVTKITKAVDGI